MGREIKFRAWDFDDKRMIYLDEQMSLVSNGEGNFKLALGSQFHDDYWQGDVSNYALMQWTGLVDCRGKDVYEGDIICDEDEEYRAILWNDALAQFALYWHDNSKKGSNKEWRYEDSMGMVVHGQYEIVGNIYENPELAGKQGA